MYKKHENHFLLFFLGEWCGKRNISQYFNLRFVMRRKKYFFFRWNSNKLIQLKLNIKLLVKNLNLFEEKIWIWIFHLIVKLDAVKNKHSKLNVEKETENYSMNLMRKVFFSQSSIQRRNFCILRKIAIEYEIYSERVLRRLYLFLFLSHIVKKLKSLISYSSSSELYRRIWQ